MAWSDLTFVGCTVLTAAKMTELQANFAALAAQESGAPAIARGFAEVSVGSLGIPTAETVVASLAVAGRGNPVVLEANVAWHNGTGVSALIRGRWRVGSAGGADLGGPWYDTRAPGENGMAGWRAAHTPASGTTVYLATVLSGAGSSYLWGGTFTAIEHVSP